MIINRAILVSILIFILIGCSNVKLSENCDLTLLSIDYQITPRKFQGEFEKCSLPISDNDLVRNYVYSLIETGEFKYLHGEDWLDNIDESIRNNWKLWVDINI